MSKSSCIQLNRLLLVLIMAVSAPGCVTTSEKVAPSQSTSQEKPSGFFDRMMDNFSERECNVGRFTCPYGSAPLESLVSASARTMLSTTVAP